MLQLLNQDKAFIPAKRLYNRKPTNVLFFKQDNEVFEMTIYNN